MLLAEANNHSAVIMKLLAPRTTMFLLFVCLVTLTWVGSRDDCWSWSCCSWLYCRTRSPDTVAAAVSSAQTHSVCRPLLTVWCMYWQSERLSLLVNAPCITNTIHLLTHYLNGCWRALYSIIYCGPYHWCCIVWITASLLSKCNTNPPAPSCLVHAPLHISQLLQMSACLSRGRLCWACWRGTWPHHSTYSRRSPQV